MAPLCDAGSFGMCVVIIVMFVVAFGLNVFLSLALTNSTGFLFRFIPDFLMGTRNRLWGILG